MHEHSDVALRDLHHRGDVGDRQIIDHAEHDGLGLVVGQRRHHSNRPIEGPVALVRDVGADRMVCRPEGRTGTTHRPTHHAAHRVDASPVGDREQPSAEIVVVTLEPVDRRRHVDPHLRRDVVGRGRAASSEVPQQRGVVAAPQLGQRITMAESSSVERVRWARHHPVVSARRRPNSSASCGEPGPCLVIVVSGRRGRPGCGGTPR